jgi:hypothetical protein
VVNYERGESFFKVGKSEYPGRWRIILTSLISKQELKGSKKSPLPL